MGARGVQRDVRVVGRDVRVVERGVPVMERGFGVGRGGGVFGEILGCFAAGEFFSRICGRVSRILVWFGLRYFPIFFGLGKISGWFSGNRMEPHPTAHGRGRVVRGNGAVRRCHEEWTKKVCQLPILLASSRQILFSFFWRSPTIGYRLEVQPG